MLSSLKRSGLVVGIVSTGLSLLAERVRSEHALDHTISNELVAENGVVTGDVLIHVAHGAKGRALLGFCDAFRIDAGAVASVGDTEGDVSMFRASGFAVAFNPDGPEVRVAADAVVQGVDLRALLPLLLSGQ